MKKVFKWIGIVIGSLVGFLLVAGAVLYLMGNSRLNKTYDFPPSNIAIPTDDVSIEFGRHRVESLCAGCHGPCSCKYATPTRLAKVNAASYHPNR